MSFTLSHSVLKLGITPDSDSALAIDLLPISLPIYTTESGLQIPAAFAELQSDNKIDRIIKLLKPVIDKTLAEGKIDFNTTPIFWLLPELAIEDNQQLIEWASQLKAHFPALFGHAKTQFFPFGSSAITMALSSMQTVIASSDVTQVCFIAVDSYFHKLDTLLEDNACITPETGRGMIPSEAVALTCISQSSQGLNIEYAKSDRATVWQLNKSVDALFYDIANYLKSSMNNGVINQFYTPSNGLDNTSDAWIDAYGRLSGHMSRTTQLKQIGLLSGEVGCVSGLYHFMHLYHAYQHGYITGNTLQLTISERLYQAVNLYSWTGKD